MGDSARTTSLLLRSDPASQGGSARKDPTTVREIGRLAGRSPDVRRFRPNVVVRSLRSVPFQENERLGGVLSFGEGDDAPAITVTRRDVRCSMVNLDPDSTSPAPEVLKAVVRANQNNAGIYGAVTRIGRLAADRPYSSVRRPRKGNMGDRNTMSRNAAQPGVKPARSRASRKLSVRPSN